MENSSLGFADHAGCGADLFGRRRVRWSIARQVLLWWPRERGCSLQNVFRDVDECRPGRPLEAMWKASARVRGTSAGPVIRKLRLVIGMVMPRMSASWKASVPMGSRETWPVIATRGTECICASASRGHETGDAGAGAGHADADVAGGLHISCGGMAVGLLVPDKNVSDVGRFEQRAVYPQNGSPGMPNTQSTPSSSSQRTID